MANGLARSLVQQDMRDDEVKRAGLEIGLLRVLLREMDALAQGLGARMGIAQDRCAHVNGKDFGFGIGIDIGQGAMPDGAAHIQDASGPEVRILLFEVQHNRLAHFVVQAAQAAHGIDIDGPVIGRSRGYVIRSQLGVITARLTVGCPPRCGRPERPGQDSG